MAESKKELKAVYTNYRVETATRTFVPIEGKLYWGKTEFHHEEQWLIDVYDVDRKANRTYALKDMLRQPV